ncbi:MAG: hypothetical protein Q8J64_04165 [Thermodesulfovibrionales bacterium]|nr:hypothetical protein [Thermodesulfovibrionales bacterium]
MRNKINHRGHGGTTSPNPSLARRGFNPEKEERRDGNALQMLYKCFTFKPFLDMVSLKINHLAIPPPSPLFYKAKRACSRFFKAAVI